MSSHRSPFILEKKYTKYVPPVLLFIAILYACLDPKPYHRYNQDHIQQLTEVTSYLKGHGLSKIDMDLSDISNTFYVPIVGWVPGYPLLIIPLISLLDNIHASVLIIDYSGIILYFCSWYIILTRLKKFLSPKLFLFTWVYWAFCFNPIALTTPTGLLSVAIFSLALAVALIYIDVNDEHVSYGLILGLLMGLCGLMRYSYWPYIVVIPTALIYLSRGKNKGYLKAGVLCLLVSIILLTAIAVWQRVHAGHAIYLTERYPNILEKGLYWNQFWHWSPFPALAIGSQRAWHLLLDFIGAKLISEHTFLTLKSVRTMGLWILSIAILITFTIFVLERFRKPFNIKKLSVEKKQVTFFTISGVLTILLTIGMLGVMSMMYKKIPDVPIYAGVERYYAPVIAFIFVGFFKKLFSSGLIKKKILIALLLVIPILNSYARTRDVFWPERKMRQWKYKSERERFSRIMWDLKSKGPVVYLDKGLSKRYIFFSRYLGIPAKRINKGTVFSTSKPVTLVIGYKKTRVAPHNYIYLFSKKYNGKKIARMRKYRFYKMDLKPGTYKIG